MTRSEEFFQSMAVVCAVMATVAWPETLWAQSDQFTAADTAAGDQFGYSMAIDGDVAVIGARRADAGGIDSGAAYVFRRMELPGEPVEWNEQTKLVPAGIDVSVNLFGTSVAIDGDVIVVGAIGDDEGGSFAGAAYVFRFDTVSESWMFEDKLIPSDSVPSDSYGQHVAILGDVIVMTSKFIDVDGITNTGAAYVFRRSSLTGLWSEEQKLVSPLPVRNGEFGRGAALNDQALVITEPFGDALGDGAGAAFVYEFNGAVWSIVQSIGPVSPIGNDWLGFSVSIDGNRMAIASRGWQQDGFVELFEHDGNAWIRTDTVAQCANSAGSFGYSVCLKGDWLLAGRDGDFRWQDTTIFSVGSAYAYHFNGATWEMEEFFFVPDGMQNDHFSFALGLVGDEALVSAPWRAEGSDITGLVYVYSDLAGTDYVTNDCNGNGLNDRCEISDGLIVDCDGNAIPDTCDLALGYRPDCNSNGIPDSCDRSASGDCNSNFIPDDCDIAAGVAVDCDGNGVIDSCEVDDYALDDGSAESQIQGSGEYYNQFVVAPGKEQIIAISVAWSSVVTEGLTVALRLWDDPNNDGDPADRVLLAQELTTTFRSGETVTWMRVPITPTIVGAAGDSFFVSQTASSGTGYITGDTNAPHLRSWYLFGGATVRWPAYNWLIRADATHPAAIPDSCLGRADSNGDGIVGIDDFLALLANWGPCPALPNACPQDSDFDGSVGILDFLNVLTNWD